MKARVFLDAFSECVVNVAMARRRPDLYAGLRYLSAIRVSGKHGADTFEKTGRMFDRLWADMQNPGAKP